LKRWVWTALVLAIAFGLSAWWTWTERSPRVSPEPLASRSAAARPEPRLPGRTYLNPEQLRQAYQSGDLDRPIKSLIAINRPLGHGEYRWDDEGVPAGPTWIRVDLNSQILSVFRAGHEIGTAVILYGAQSKQTPPGKYPIMSKAREHRSSIYDADMPFTLRLTGDGISIHASNVRWGAATHGCIGVPPVFAEKLFDAVAVKDDVLVLDKGVRAATGAKS
jgi:hypothetical protein